MKNEKLKSLEKIVETLVNLKKEALKKAEEEKVEYKDVYYDLLTQKIIKELTEEIKKEIEYEDREKVLPGDIKVVERKIIKFPIFKNYEEFIKDQVEKELGKLIKRGLKKRVEYLEWDYILQIIQEIECLAFRHITNGRFPSYYTATHVYNGYCNGNWSEESKKWKAKTAFDEILNDKINFPIWISFAYHFPVDCKGERTFIFGKKIPVFEKALEETAKKFETNYFSFKELLSLVIKHPAAELSTSWRRILATEHPLGPQHLDLLCKIEGVNEVALVGAATYDAIDKTWETHIREKRLEELAIPTLMYHDVPLFTCPTRGVKINVLGDIKFKDAEMYLDLLGYTRDKYKILSEGPKVLFFYDPHKEYSSERCRN